LNTYDLVNIIDWPLVAFGKETKAEETTSNREYRISIYNKNNHHPISGYLRIYYIQDEKTNTLLPQDEDLLLALISFGSESYFSNSRVLTIQSVTQIVRRLKLKKAGKNSARIKDSLRRLAGMIFETDIWYNKQTQTYGHAGFHIIDSYHTVKNVEITWGKEIADSILSGHIKPLDFDLYLKIKKPGARKLYRVLSKRFYKHNRPIEIPIEYLARQIFGFSPSKSRKYCISQIEEYTNELVKVGYLGIYEITDRLIKPSIKFALPNKEES